MVTTTARKDTMSYEEYEIDEYGVEHAYPVKCRETCARCRYGHCLDDDQEFDFCSNFDRKKRRCKCFNAERGEPCRCYVEE